MRFRKRLDIGYRDLFWALSESLARKPENSDPLDSIDFKQCEILPTLSVRSGFDLLLECLNLETGSEILMTAITIPDMPRIVSNRNLTPVPLDVDPLTLQPSVEAIRAAYTEKTKAIVVAHLFGNTLNLEPIARLARELGLILIEDCAQAFRTKTSLANSLADVSMFSFGTIKTHTCLGGGIMVIRDNPNLHRAMSRIHATYAAQADSEYAGKIIKALLIKLVTTPYAFRLIYGIARLAGYDYDTAVHRASKSFPGDDFFERIRRRPSKLLLKVMKRRLASVDENAIAERVSQGERTLQELGRFAMIPGSKSQIRAHWVFPILCDDRRSLIDSFRRNGFDATDKCSLGLVGDELGSGDCSMAKALINRLVFLPLDVPLAKDESELLCDLVREHALPSPVTHRDTLLLQQQKQTTAWV